MQRQWIIVLLVMTAGLSPARAIRPGEWSQDSEADFQKFKRSHTVINTRGQVLLSGATDELAKLQKMDSIIYDTVVLANGTIVAAIGPKGRLMALTPGDRELKEIRAYENEQVFDLLVDGDRLWVAVSGVKARLEQIDLKGNLVKSVPVPGAFYLWQMRMHQGRMILATGPDGKLLAVDPAGVQSIELLFDAEQENILCLAADAQGRLYIGTDQQGLVIRLMPSDRKPSTRPASRPSTRPATDSATQPAQVATWDGYILFDAPEPEIGSLLVDADGVVYAGTADAEGAKPGRMKAPKTDSHTGEPAPGSNKEPELPDQDRVVPESQPAQVSTTEPSPVGQPAMADAPAPVAPSPDNRSARWVPVPVRMGQRVYQLKVDRRLSVDQQWVQAGAQLAAAMAEQTGKTPSPEQYDQLRTAISRKLDQAEQQGRMMIKARPQSSGGGVSSSGGSGGSSGSRSGRSSGKKGGNAVYRIDRQGFCQELFRESVIILDMVFWGRKLLVATGDEGQLYQLDPAGEREVVLVKLDVKQIMRLHPLPDDAILMATANGGRLYRLRCGYAKKGTLTSPVHDAGHISLWGKLKVWSTVPEGTSVAIQTRVGNSEDPEKGGWSQWTTPIPVADAKAGAPNYLSPASPPARFIQYRVQLTGDGEKTPLFRGFAMKYISPNLPPKISSLKVDYAKPEGSKGLDIKPLNVIELKWEASDPNTDQLAFRIYSRLVGKDEPFVRIAKDIKEDKFKWSTQTLPDGRYQFRVLASDLPDNLPQQARTAVRISREIVVDNTPPVFEELQVQPAGEQAVSVHGTARDAWTEITSIRYVVDGKVDQWQYVMPKDMLYDSTRESFSFKIAGLSPGPHVISLRAVDAQGNAAYVARTIQVAGK